MAETTVHIAGRQYALNCRDGEEAHLTHLASLIEGAATAAKANAPGMTEVRTLLFAALFLADELNDLKRETAKAHPQPALDSDDAPVAQAIEGLAARIESLTQRLAAA